MDNKTFRKKLCRMFGFALAVLLTSLQAPQATAQTSGIVLSMPDASIQEVVKEIERQTRYVFFYNDIDISHKLSVDIRDKSINETLDTVFKGTDIAWHIDGLQIVLSRKTAPAAASSSQPIEVSGVVTDTQGLPLIGAAVFVKDTSIGASTDIDGSYTFRIPPPHTVSYNISSQLFRL